MCSMGAGMQGSYILNLRAPTAHMCLCLVVMLGAAWLSTAEGLRVPWTRHLLQSELYPCFETCNKLLGRNELFLFVLYWTSHPCYSMDTHPPMQATNLIFVKYMCIIRHRQAVAELMLLQIPRHLRSEAVDQAMPGLSWMRTTAT